MTTRRAYRAMFNAAWPAELAAPTTYTSSPSHDARLARGRAVVDATAGEVAEPRCVEQPIGHARRDEDRAGLDLRPVVEAHGADRPAHLEAHDVLRQDHLGAEPPSLRDGAVGEVCAGQALGEAQVVLDRRALPGLAAWRLAFDDDCLQALGGAVDGGGEPGRSATHDAQVVEGLLGPGAQAERGWRDRGVDGPRRVSPSGTSTSGRSAVLARARVCSRAASSSRSTSSQRYGTWLRARNVLISLLRSDHRCPTTRSTPVSAGWAARQSSSRSSMTG